MSGLSEPVRPNRIAAIATLFLFVGPGEPAEPSFLARNPEIKKQLLQWEREAPEEVKVRIRNLRYVSGEAGWRLSESRARTASALGRLGPRAKGAVLALLETFDTTKEFVWLPSHHTSAAEQAALALGRIGFPAVEPLIAALKDEQRHIRKFSAMALGEIKAPRAVDPLIAALKEDDPLAIANVEAAEALGKISMTWWQRESASVVISEFIAALDHEEHKTRMSAISGLSTARDPRVVDALVGVLKNNEKFWEERLRVADVLGNLGDRRAIPHLVEALKSTDGNLAYVAARSLSQLDPDAWKSYVPANLIRRVTPH